MMPSVIVLMPVLVVLSGDGATEVATESVATGDGVTGGVDAVAAAPS